MSEMPQGQPAPQQEQPPLHQATGNPAAKLHDLALSAEKNLEQLATALSQNGADPGAVKAVSTMADVMRKMLKTMASQAQAEQPPQPRHTMDSATNSLAADIRARRQQ